MIVAVLSLVLGVPPGGATHPVARAARPAPLLAWSLANPPAPRPFGDCLADDDSDDEAPLRRWTEVSQDLPARGCAPASGFRARLHRAAALTLPPLPPLIYLLCTLLI